MKYLVLSILVSLLATNVFAKQSIILGRDASIILSDLVDSINVMGQDPDGKNCFIVKGNTKEELYLAIEGEHLEELVSIQLVKNVFVIYNKVEARLQTTHTFQTTLNKDNVKITVMKASASRKLSLEIQRKNTIQKCSE